MLIAQDTTAAGNRTAKIRRLARQLEKLWPAPRTPRPRTPPAVKPAPKDTPPAPPAKTAGELLAEVLGVGEPEAAKEAPAAPAAAPAGRVSRSRESGSGRRPGEYIDTVRVVSWLNATGHRTRWLAKQLDVSKAHLNNCLLGFSKLSYSRARKLDGMMTAVGGAVS